MFSLCENETRVQHNPGGQYILRVEKQLFI